MSHIKMSFVDKLTTDLSHAQATGLATHNDHTTTCNYPAGPDIKKCLVSILVCFVCI